MDEEKTWGTILRALRGRDTQEKLVVKLEAYIIYSKKEISVFENDRRLPDRSTQVQFVRAFIDLGRIKSLEQANEWLKAGKSSDLDQNEINNLLDEGLITEAWLPQSKTVNDPLIEEIKDFRAQYLGTKFKERAPFGGRQKQLDELDRWLKDKAEPPYLLLTAPAGRGKSALLVHWSERLKSHPALFVIFVPVSINYETNSSEKIFRILTDYLATFHREQNTDDINTSTKDFGAEVSAYMRLPVPDTQKLVIIVDGVDEAADNLVGPTLFPAEPPSGLKVVVSARQIPDDSISWRDKLNWSSKLAQSLTLPLLDRKGIEDVVRKMGTPLDKLSSRVDIVAELCRLSQGEPLLVKLYVDDLLSRGEQAARLLPEDLQTIQPKLDGYFDRWWDDQKKLWKKQGKDKTPKIVYEILYILAAALGPITQADIMKLANLDYIDELKDAVQDLSRFVMGDGVKQGYFFSHPKLSQHFWDTLKNADKHLVWEQRFLTWGQQTLQGLNNRTVSPGDEKSCRYPVRYYRRHLDRYDCHTRHERPIEPAMIENYLDLVSDGWRRGWEALEGGYGGFLNDVNRAWQIAQEANLHAVEMNKTAPYLGGEILCALCQVSIHNLVVNVPPVLVLALHKNYIWTQTQALAHIRHISDPKVKAETLENLALQLPKETQGEVLEEALVTARQIDDLEFRVNLLVRLAPRFPEEIQGEVWSEALVVARQIINPASRARVLVRLAPHLQGETQDEVWGETLAAARQITTSSKSRVEALVEVAHHLPAVTRSEVWKEILAIARQLVNEWPWQGVLIELIPNIPVELMKEAQAVAYQVADLGLRAEVLARLAPRFPEEIQGEVWREVLVITEQIDNDKYRAEVLTRLASRHLPEDLIRKTLMAAQKFLKPETRAEVLIMLAPHLPEVASQYEAWRSALKVVTYPGSKEIRARILVKLISSLPEDLLGEALATTRQLGDEHWRTRALLELAHRRSEDLMSEVLAEARQISDPVAQAEALAGVAPYLPQPTQNEVWIEAFEATQQIILIFYDEKPRSELLEKIAPHLPAERMREALTEVRKISNPDQYARALAKLIPKLPGDLVGEVQTWVRQLGDKSSRSQMLARLALRLPIETQNEVWKEALVIASQVDNEGEQVDVLVELAACLPPATQDDIWKGILEILKQIDHQWSRTRGLTELAHRLPHKLMEEALAIAKELPDEMSRVEAMMELATHFPESKQDDIWRKVLAIASQINDENFPEKVLMKLIFLLPTAIQDDVWRDILVMVKGLDDEKFRTKVLSDLVPHLPSGLIEETLEITRKLSHVMSRTEVMTELASRFPEATQGEVLSEALEIARQLDSKGPWTGDVLAELVSYLPAANQAEVWGEALKSVRRIYDEWSRAGVLVNLLPHLQGAEKDEVLREAFGIATQLDNDWFQVNIVTKLVPYLSEDLMEEALIVVRKLFNHDRRTWLLMELIPRPPNELLEEALAIAIQIDDEKYRHEVLMKLIPHLPRELMRKALAAVEQLEDEKLRIEVLIELIPRLPDELLGETLSIARHIDSKWYQANILVKLVQRLPGELMEEVLAIARQIGIAEYRFEVMIEILHCMPENPIVEEVMGVARQIHYPQSRFWAFVSIIDYLPPATQDEAYIETLAIAREIEDKETFFPVTKTETRQKALKVVVPKLETLPLARLYRCWQDTVPILTQRSLKDFLADLETLMPLVVRLGGEKTVEEAAQAIIKVGRWWP